MSDLTQEKAPTFWQRGVTLVQGVTALLALISLVGTAYLGIHDAIASQDWQGKQTAALVIEQKADIASLKDKTSRQDTAMMLLQGQIVERLARLETKMDALAREKR